MFSDGTFNDGMFWMWIALNNVKILAVAAEYNWAALNLPCHSDPSHVAFYTK